ncbi:hypothetical protein Acor_26370 [Acrocarpospora corrugata]|uniref:Uncharacterized protein n=1 Tax=Acrocarpospora corrugata TaxID=35763 RepID=A0A5M3VZR0_9ACTN|nr:hypothetical protein [Acrocarpospora corrugata]GES00573.1 hypothetical protein Acor_26370 [Acrocarpospora corrugata]
MSLIAPELLFFVGHLESAVFEAVDESVAKFSYWSIPDALTAPECALTPRWQSFRPAFTCRSDPSAA